MRHIVARDPRTCEDARVDAPQALLREPLEGGFSKRLAAVEQDGPVATASGQSAMLTPQLERTSLTPRFHPAAAR